MIIEKTGLYGEHAQIVPECLFDKTEPCRLHPCCEAQNVSCCHACMHRKCPSRCEKGTKK